LPGDCFPCVNYSERRDKELLSAPGTTIVPPGPGLRSFWISVLLSALVTGFFLWGAAQVKELKTVPEVFGSTGYWQDDELHAMQYALHAKKYHEEDPEDGVTESFLRWLPHATDGEMQPLWPRMASRLVEADHAAVKLDYEQDIRLLQRGRRAQLWLAGGFLLLCGVLAARALCPAAAVAAILPGAMAVLLPYGVWFQPDLLHWVLVFLSWVCALRLLRRNSVWLHGVFGVLSGLAWLTDATALIVPAAWLAAATARWLMTSLRRGEQTAHETWIARNHFVGLVALLFGWIAVCGPRCGAAMDFWGRPLFTWQQTWMWFDSAEEARQFTQRYNDAKEVAGRRVPLQGWDGYWEKHTAEQARKRLTGGWQETWREFLSLDDDLRDEGRDALTGLSSRRGWWLGGAALMFVIAGIFVLGKRPSVIGGLRSVQGSSAAALFVALASAGYGLWFAWYRPIESDERLLLVIYLPLVWSLVWGAESLMKLARMRGASPGMYAAWQIAVWLINAAVAVDAFLLLRATDPS
jgi:hypothetical protein